MIFFHTQGRQRLDIDDLDVKTDHAMTKIISPCLYCTSLELPELQSNKSVPLGLTKRGNHLMTPHLPSQCGKKIKKNNLYIFLGKNKLVISFVKS